MWIEENNKLVKPTKNNKVIQGPGENAGVVTIKLSTHDIGNKVSKKDYDLAKAIDELL